MAAVDDPVEKSPTTFETALAGTDTLVVHAPALGVEHVRGSICDTTTDGEHVRVDEDPSVVGEDPSAVGEATTDATGGADQSGTVVVEDLYTAYADADPSTWDSLTTHLTTPETTVAVFVEAYALDWLLSNTASCDTVLASVDQIVHLRYRHDDTERFRDVDDAVARAREVADRDLDAGDEDIRATLSTLEYSHDYQYETLAGETYGPTLAPGLVEHLSPAELDQGVSIADVRETLSDVTGSGTLREFFQNAESAVSELLSPAGVGAAAATVHPALGAGAAFAVWLWLRDGDDDVPPIVEQFRRADLPPTTCAELDAELEEPPGTVATAQRLSEPSIVAELVEMVREGGRIDELEATQEQHEAVLAEHGEELASLRDRMAEVVERVEEVDDRVDEVEEDVEEVDDRVDEVEEDVEELQGSMSTNPGVDRVTATEFEDGAVDEENCWRRAFTLAEAWAGYPLERERPLAGETDERQDLTEQLLAAVADGGGAALLGAPGSGKTTATRTAMAAWYRRHDDGTVLYRTKTTEATVDPEALTERIEAIREDGPVLVVVEDAARRGTYPVYETVAEFEGADDVSFLVNSREEEWRDSEEGMTETFGGMSQAAADVRTVQSKCFDLVDMPPLDAREIERFVENYQQVTDPDVSLDVRDGSDEVDDGGDDIADAEALLSQIRGHSGISPMLLLAYHIPVWEGQDEVRVDTDVPALVANVREVFRFVHGESDRELEADSDREAELVKRVALAVNVLNAAEVPVREEFLLALGDDEEERTTISKLQDRVQGPLLFEGDDHTFETHHPLWSQLYLSEHRERVDGKVAVRVFEDVVNDLFELVDDGERRERIRETLRTDTVLLKNIEREPAAFAYEFVVNVFEIGENRPELQPLYGTSAYSGIELPSAGGARVAVEAAFGRARMFNGRGESDREHDEIEWAWERATEAGIDDGLVAANYHARRGHYAMQQGEFETAREQFEQAREAAPSDEESQHEATSLNNLGLVARNLGEYEQAREYYNQSLAIDRKIGDRAGEADSLNNLGVVAQRLGEYEQAREYHTQSLAIKQEIGDRAGEAEGLGNLGAVAQNLGEYEQAREYYNQSLAIFREIGDRAGEATSLGNLGAVAQLLGEYERARKYHKKSLAIKQEIGDRAGEATSLDNLGLVAQNLGEYEQARESHKKSLAITREIGDRAGEADSLNNLGSVAGEQEDYEEAERRHREALTISEEIGDRRGVALQQYNVGVDAGRQGDLERALEWLQKSRATYADLGVDHEVLDRLDSISRVAQQLDRTETARKACADALELIEHSDLDRLQERAREFRIRHARLDETPAGTLRLYSHALDYALEGEVGTAAQLFDETWERRDTHDEDSPVLPVTLAAGVGFAAHLTLAAEANENDPGDGETPDPDDVLAEIDPAELSTAATSLYHTLTRGVPITSPADLREQADQIDPDSFDDRVGILERRAYASLIEALSEVADDDAATPVERYEQALFRFVTGTDTDAAVDTLASLWEHHDEHDSNTDDHAAATAAGVWLAGVDAGTVDDADVPVDAETVLQSVDPDAAGFDDAVRAVHDFLVGDDPDHTAEELHDRVDSSVPPDLTQLETAASAGVLTTLTEDDDTDDPTATDLYHDALVRVNSGDADPARVVALLRRAWDRRERHEPGTEEFAHATAAGVAFLAYEELLPDQTAAVSGDTELTLAAIDPDAAELSDAARALSDTLAGTDPTHTSAELHDRVDTPVDDRDLPQLERLVFARLLGTLDN